MPRIIILILDIISIIYAIKNKTNVTVKWGVIIFNIISIFAIYYNTMLIKKNKVKNAFSSLDVMFKKRNDLIPNLVSTVKGYMEYEKDTLERVIALRNNLINRNSIRDNLEMSQHINDILATIESYPDLKANEQVLKLQKTLYDLEEMISAGRRTYNAHVTNYNTFISMFPNLLFAKLFGFKKFELFKVDEELRKGKIYYNEK